MGSSKTQFLVEGLVSSVGTAHPASTCDIKPVFGGPLPGRGVDVWKLRALRAVQYSQQLQNIGLQRWRAEHVQPSLAVSTCLQPPILWREECRRSTRTANIPAARIKRRDLVLRQHLEKPTPTSCIHKAAGIFIFAEQHIPGRLS